MGARVKSCPNVCFFSTSFKTSLLEILHLWGLLQKATQVEHGCSTDPFIKKENQSRGEKNKKIRHFYFEKYCVYHKKLWDL